MLTVTFLYATAVVTHYVRAQARLKLGKILFETFEQKSPKVFPTITLPLFKVIKVRFDWISFT